MTNKPEVALADIAWLRDCLKAAQRQGLHSVQRKFERLIAACEQSTAALQAENARLREREAELVTTLRIAERHLRHMAAWIGRRKAGYNFESLGEDMPTIEAALASKEGEAGQVITKENQDD